MAFVELKDFYQYAHSSVKPGESEAGQFNVFKIEEMYLPGKKPVSYSKRDFYKVSLVTGESIIHYADHSIHVANSVLVFTNPMLPYFWERISEQHTGFVCVFTETFFNRFFNLKEYPVFQSADNGVIVLSPDELHAFIELFTRMHQELNGNYVFKYDLLRNLLMEVIHAGQKLNPAAGSKIQHTNASERITGLFAELLERQFPIEVSNQVIKLNTPSAFAGQLNLHVNHLNKALKEVTGQTTSQLINKRILEEAKILLKSTNWTINEIAWGLGFEEPNHFSSFFKGKAGVTPKNFRQLIVD